VNVGPKSIHDERKPRVPVTALERLVRKVYGRVDEAAGRELVRLRRVEGVVPSCKQGCCNCCRQHIQTSLAEAHALGQYVKRAFSAEQIRHLRRRTRHWHAWHAARRCGDFPDGSRAGPQLSEEEPWCPLLVDRSCSAYPARPIICRTHFVRSDPAACCGSLGQPSSECAAVVIASILHATRPFSEPLRARVENAGLDFTRSILLLPHWLAIEMGWDFAEES
jgi:Fe-S-cluster containining protein